MAFNHVLQNGPKPHLRQCTDPAVAREVESYDLVKKALQKDVEVLEGAKFFARAVLLREKYVPCHPELFATLIQCLEANDEEFSAGVLRGYLFLNQQQFDLCVVMFRKLYMAQVACVDKPLCEGMERKYLLARLLALEAGAYMFSGSRKECARVQREILALPFINELPSFAGIIHEQYAIMLLEKDLTEKLKHIQIAIDMTHSDSEEMHNMLYLLAYCLCLEMGPNNVSKAREAFRNAQAAEHFAKIFYGHQDDSNYKQAAYGKLGPNASHQVVESLARKEQLDKVWATEGKQAAVKLLNQQKKKGMLEQVKEEKESGGSFCFNCGEAAKSGQKLKVCAGCRKFYFCSTECQTVAWKRGHKTTCKVFARQAKK